VKIPNEILATTLKHLNLKKSNYYRSLGMDPSNSDQYNHEIDRLTESINFFEELRTEQRTA
tara:strand:+ start:1869 stop:2051 length:183 start_codon:yes stop_codon:yes gene_type:complete